jgi:hypothetical protein
MEFEFIVERDKLDKIKKVIAHNDGEIIDETPVTEDVRIRVRKEKQRRE